MRLEVKAANSMPKKHAEPVMSLHYISSIYGNYAEYWESCLQRVVIDSCLSIHILDSDPKEMGLKKVKIASTRVLSIPEFQHIQLLMTDMEKWSMVVSYHKQEPKVVLGQPLPPYELSYDKEQQYLELLSNITKALAQATKK